MLQQAKADGDGIAGTPFTAMHTLTAMDHIDATPRLGARGAPCETSVKGLSVVVEKHYAWALPIIVAGIAPNCDGVPFGYLNSVSDLTKSSHADSDEAIATIHLQAFSGAFIYTAVHEASHYLGLAPGRTADAFCAQIRTAVGRAGARGRLAIVVTDTWRTHGGSLEASAPAAPGGGGPALSGGHAAV